jgi:CRP/FNR family cyclic AMP-dependent transcriptional regulator
MDSFSTGQRKWQRDEVAQLLTSTTALTELDLDAARVVVRTMKTSNYKKGTVLMQEGVASNGFMMLILRGEVVVEQQQLRRSDALILGVVGAGSVLGEMSLMDGEPRSATCTAFTDIEAAVLDRAALIALMDADPRACSKLLAVLFKRVSERLRATNKKLRAVHQVAQTLREHVPEAKAAGLAPLVAAPSEGMILL